MTSTYASSILRKTLGRASRSKKPQNQTQRADFPKKGNLQKPKPFSFMLILLALLCGRSVAWAQAQGEWNGSATNDTYTISSDMTINSTVTIGNTDVLTLLIKADVTISRKNTTNLLMFHVKPGGKLNIIGDAKPGGGYYKATFDGGSTVILDDLTQYPDFEGDYVHTVANKMGIMWNNMGNVTIKHARITGFQVRDGNGSRGVINLVSDNPPNNVTTGTMLLEDVEIDHCWGGPAIENGSGVGLGRIISLQGGKWDATLTNVELHHCFSCEHPDSNTGIHHFGGIIRTEGGITGTLTVDGCRFYNNKYKYWKQGGCRLIGQGGVINWRAGGSGASDTRLIITNSEFYDNQAAEGGAIATNATIEMSNNVKIYNNKAIDGGGVYFWTYNGGKNEYDGRAFDAIFGNNVNIYNNTATQYGGGIYIGIDASDDVGFNAITSPPWNPVTDTASVLFNVEIQTGATIESNKAPKGAGIAIRDAAPYRHMNKSPNLVGNAGPNPAVNQWSGVYRRKVNIAGGTVCNNTTTGDEMAGAGIYIEKYEYPADHTFHSDYNYGNAPGTYGAGTLTVNAESGLIYGNTAINGIKPGFGGGMYIASKFETNTIKSTLNVNIGETGKNLEMYNNQAYTDGGGVYVWYDRTNGRKNEGTVTVKGGTIGKTNLANKALTGNGGGICVMSGTVVVKNGHVDYNTANQKGGGIYLDDGNLTFTGGNVDQNEASNSDGGGICVMGGTVEVAGGHVDHNTANQNGGGIYLDGGNLTFTGGNVDQNEASNGNGGGICVMSGTVSVENGHVDHNTANQKGGGIYLNGGDLTFKGGSVDQNEASNSDGGGICVEGGNIVVSGGTVSNNKAILKNGGGICVLGGTVLVEGGNILTNTANELGGGVYVSVQDATIITKIQGGANISSNSAKGGGGVYVDKGKLDVVGNVWNTTTQGWDLLPWPTGTYNPASEATHTRITNNTASDGNGGGINAGDGTVEITNTLIYHNTASGTVSKGRGGGVYLDGGIIKIVSSKILNNTAETNGGGIDDHSGDIEIYGGDISYNTATNGRGGGIYTNAGDIRIWPSALYGNPVSAPSLNDCKNTGTVFSYNKAGTNGGGLNTHIGRLDVRYANVHHNEAGTTYGSNGQGPDGQGATGSGGSGGGMFCEGPHADLSGYTVRLLHTYLDNNKAFGNSDEESNLTGRGGGLYLKYGSIFAEHCYVRNNEADINGGGLDNHDGELRVYGSFVEDNEAKNGKGGGLYTDKGNLVVGPCDSYGFVESKASRICNNTAHINGGGINNHLGNITIHGDRINNNTAETGDGGGVYINSGKINMYGGQINNNKADNGKGGGVYGGGGTFNIMEREAHPILEILDVENITTSGFTVHFHHVDRGFAMDSDATDKEYGIAFSENPYPSNLGENEEWTVGTGTNTDWTGVTTVSFNPTSTHPTPQAPHSYNQYEGCSRFVVNNTPNGITINSNTTYYVVAYGKYQYDGKNYFDASPVVKVKTHGDNPVVVTGVAFDITTNSASVNGKLFYEGVGTQLKKGIEILSDDGLTWVKHQAESVGDVFSVTFSGLESSKIYKARAYATCQDGEHVYESQDAEIITFFTYGVSPVVATGEASEITTNSATVSGELLYVGDGSSTVTKGIRYRIRIGEGEWTNVASTDTEAEFSVTLTGLESGTTYQAQAYATKGENTVCGEIITFTTATGSKAPQGPRSVYPAVEENPFFQELTPLQQAIMASTPVGDSLGQTATRGSNGNREDDEDQPVNIPEINNNTATYGGGICIDKQGARLIFSGKRGEVDDDDPIGQINYNYASEAGGGIYIGRESADKYAQMQMMGKCEVNKNRVPAGKLGGGIYLDGRFYVGDKDTDLIGTHGLKVDKNFAITKDQTNFVSELAVVLDDDTPPENPLVKEYNKAMNNIFLPRNDYDYQEHDNNAATNVFNKVSVLTLLSDISGYVDENNNGIIDDNEKTPYSHIGFSVLNGFCPVIATADHFGGNYVIHDDWEGAPEKGSEEWLYNLMRMSGGGGSGDQTVDALIGAVFEDSESYVAVHTRRDLAPFREKYIYLWGCWTHPIVKEDPERNTGHEAGLADDDQSMKGTGKHYKITEDENNILTWEIYSPEGLAWFSSYVNGLNVFDQKLGGGDGKHEKWNANINPYAKAIIMKDLDMSAYLWVPIGSVQKFYLTALTSETEGSLFVDSETPVTMTNPDDPTEQIPDPQYTNNAHYYKGTFDGQGHIIKGLQGLYLTGIRKFGLFGYLAEDAIVKNTFVDEGLFVSDDEEVIYSSGGIAGEMKAGTLSNSEARMTFNVTYSHDDTYVGGLVGKMSGTAVVHSSMAMPEIVGTAGYMGGLVGQVGTNSKLLNSFANPYFPNATTSPYYDIYGSGAFIGGLVGDNQGIVENCYTRLQGDEPTYDGIHSVFGWFAGTNSVEAKEDKMGGIRFCYAPAPANPTDYVKSIAYPDIINGSFGIEVVNPDPGTEEPFGAGNYGPTDYESGCGKYGFKHRDQQMTENADNDFIVNDVFLGGLLPTLNNWVAANAGYTTWTRTMASKINDDYPVLQIADFNVVGSEDGIYMKYDTCVNRMWETDGKNFQSLTKENNPKAAMYLYNTNYNPISIDENTAVRLHIHEDVGITQTNGAELHARVGVTIKDDNWHLFSSALRSAPVGLNYPAEGFPVNNGDDVYETDYRTRSYMDPEYPTTWIASSSIYFPTNTPYGTWKNEPATTGYFDLYDYSESYYHWINYKRANDDHWHMDADTKGYHQKFGNYDNDETMPFGKGYLMSLSDVSMMMADGVLNNSDQTLTLSKSGNGANFQTGSNAQPNNGYTAIWRGIHLLGNPYQSYLNFSSPSSSKADGGILPTYAILDESRPGKDHYIYYTKSQSRNVPLYAEGTIHPHQGFFVKVKDGGGSFAFTSTMRQSGMNIVPFRDQIDYPLVNLLCYDEDGERDHTTVEVNRPEFGGGEKMESLHKSKGMIYAQLEGESFQILFAPEGVTTVPVRFEAKEDGVFTLNWNTRHGEFSYLHLVDNIAGVDIDCLTADEYKFEGKMSDFRSRFKLVFRCEGDEPEDPEDPDAPEDEDPDHFAFIFGNELVVNGEGILQMFDIQGRCLMETQAIGSQSNHNLPRVSAGVYLLRLTGDKKVRVQKMVIK